MASVLGSSLEASSESDTLVFTIGSSSKSSWTSSDPLSGDNSTLGTWVAKTRMEDGVTTNKDPCLTTCERVVKGSLAEITSDEVTGEAFSSWVVIRGTSAFKEVESSKEIRMDSTMTPPLMGLLSSVETDLDGGTKA